MLETYNSERRAAALKLIEIDHAVASAISNVVPPQYGAPDADIDEVLARIWKENMGFSIGLEYRIVSQSLSRRHKAGTFTQDIAHGTYCCGDRDPGFRCDCKKCREQAGLGDGRSSSLLGGGGYPSATKDKINALRGSLEADAKFSKKWNPFPELGYPSSPAQSGARGLLLVARRSADCSSTMKGFAHNRYGFSNDLGGIVILRPDGIVGFLTSLDGIEQIKEYFEDFCI